MMVDNNQSLPVVRVADIVTEENPQRWLIDQLWGSAAVGVIGGAPKCSKTWLALDMSLSVATGTACLDRYEVPQPGPVLVYLAEDALAIVRERVEGIARHRGLQLDSVPIHVITAPVLRLDRDPCTSISSPPTTRRCILRWLETSVARSDATCRSGCWISLPKKEC